MFLNKAHPLTFESRPDIKVHFAINVSCIQRHLVIYLPHCSDTKWISNISTGSGNTNQINIYIYSLVYVTQPFWCTHPLLQQQNAQDD